MVYLEDPLTGDHPTRTTAEEDEDLAQGDAEGYFLLPDISLLASSPKGATLVVLCGPAAALLTPILFPAASPLGRAELVLASALPPHTTDLSLARRGLVVAAAAREVPVERAHAWARGLRAALEPSRIVVACSLPARDYRGSLDPAHDDIVHAMSLEASGPGFAGSEVAALAGLRIDGGDEPTTTPPATPSPLPSGTLLAGAPAALLDGDDDLALVAIQPTPVIGPGLLSALAQAVLVATGQPGIGAGLGGVAWGGELRAAVREVALGATRVSDAAAMYA